MSKKIASGADIIMLDVKVGSGALMKTLEDARKLAETMVKIGKAYRKPTICLITNMDEPLGFAIGNALEVEESINTLKGNGPSDLLEVVMTLCSIIIGAVKKIPNNEAKNLLFKQLNNGDANMTEEKELLKVGKFNPEFNNILNTSIQDLDIYMSKGLPSHMIKRKHFKCLKYIDNISEIIANPDYIGINPNEQGSSIELIKKYAENVMIGIKIDTDKTNITNN